MTERTETQCSLKNYPLLARIAAARTRMDVARVIAGMLLDGTARVAEWPDIQPILVERWCVHGASYVKTAVWKMLGDARKRGVK